MRAGTTNPRSIDVKTIDNNMDGFIKHISIMDHEQSPERPGKPLAKIGVRGKMATLHDNPVGSAIVEVS